MVAFCQSVLLKRDDDDAITLTKNSMTKKN